MLFRIYSRKTLKYFLRWKLKSRISLELFNSHLTKFMRFRAVFRLMGHKYKLLAKNCLAKWSFQVKHGFPFYSNTIAESWNTHDFLKRVNKRIEKFTKRRGNFHYHQFYQLLEQLVMSIEVRLENLKRISIRKMKVLYETEQKVLDIQQPLMIRTLSINLPYFKQVFHSDLKRLEMTPGAIINVMEGSRRIRDRKRKINVEGTEPKYYDLFLDKMLYEKDKPRDAHYLVKGIWASQGPFFKLREYAMVKLLYRKYMKWVSICYTKLKFNRDLSNMISKRRKEMEVDNNHFRKVWARLMLVTMIISKTESICNNVMISFEANKMKKLLDNDVVDSKPTKLNESIRELQSLPDYEDLIRDTFKQRLGEVKKSFSKSFLLTILRPGVTHKVIRKDLTNLIIDTMYFMVYGTVDAAYNLPLSLNR